MKGIIRSVMVVVSIFILVGCAAPARIGHMTITSEDSLLAAGLLEHVKGKGIYSLDVNFMSVDQPFIGASFTVTTNVKYALKHVKSDKVIFEENILAPYTATMSDALYGVERLRLANEGSARENISRLIARLYQLNIPVGDTIMK